MDPKAPGMDPKAPGMDPKLGTIVKAGAAVVADEGPGALGRVITEEPLDQWSHLSAHGLSEN